jgi:YVTN family beta-propeller protein
MRRKSITILHGVLAWASVAALITAALPSHALASMQTFYLHGSGPVANPSVLALNQTAPVAAAAKYRDSGSVNFNGGNAWQTIGIWPADTADADGILTSLDDLHLWLGLKNSDDQGTRFDVRAEVLKNGELIATGLERCVAGVTRNANLAKEVIIPFGQFPATPFNGDNDILSLRVTTRIGTNGNDTKCAGHNNATGLRTYFDAANRQARLGATIAPLTATGKAYVTNTSIFSNSVSVIDLATNQTVKTIPVGNEPRGISYHPGTHRVYVVNTYGSQSVSVIDTVSDTVVDTISLGSTLAFNAAISPDGSRLYLSGGVSGDPGSTITVIDTTLNAVIATITGLVSATGALTVSPDGSRLYAADQNCCFAPAPNGYVRVIDTTTNQIMASVEVGVHATGIAVTPDGNRIYVTNPASGSVSVIDTATNTVVKTLFIPDNPTGITVNSTGTRVYVADTNGTAATVYTIDTATDDIIRTLSIGPSPIFLALSTDDSMLYATDNWGAVGGDAISAIDTATNTLVSKITVGAHPWDITTGTKP